MPNRNTLIVINEITDAFKGEDNARSEISRILASLAVRFGQGQRPESGADINGNGVVDIIYNVDDVKEISPLI